MFDNCSIPLLSSERGMILVIALVCYTILALEKAPEMVLTTVGALLLLGFGFYFKDKAAEAVQFEAAKTEVAKIEAAK
jgi:hypothetical protein